MQNLLKLRWLMIKLAKDLKTKYVDMFTYKVSPGVLLQWFIQWMFTNKRKDLGFKIGHKAISLPMFGHIIDQLKVLSVTITGLTPHHDSDSRDHHWSLVIVQVVPKKNKNKKKKTGIARKDKNIRKKKINREKGKLEKRYKH